MLVTYGNREAAKRNCTKNGSPAGGKKELRHGSHAPRLFTCRICAIISLWTRTVRIALLRCFAIPKAIVGVPTFLTG